MSLLEHLALYTCCPTCKQDLQFENERAFCASCAISYPILDGSILSAVSPTSNDTALSLQKWDELYRQQIIDASYTTDQAAYRSRYFPFDYAQLKKAFAWTNQSVFLEIGAGPMHFSYEIAPSVALVIGVDFSLSALKIAEAKFKSAGIQNYLLIHGDLRALPIKKEVIDFLFGCGVIEHFQDTTGCLKELLRVTKPNGVCVNTVPYLNIGSLTYRQLWGNIPNVPGIRTLFEFLHIKLLKGRHMQFGYELSFLASTLTKNHRDAGFHTTVIDRYDIPLAFAFVPRILRRLCIFLATHSRLFWPMIKIVAIK